VTTVRVNVDEKALRRLIESQGIEAALTRVGDQVAERAAQAAPKDSGEGARSIRAEVAHDEDGPHVNVSWDKAHFYMAFHELGTSRMSARPFLRPALDAQYEI